jgi:hypothetical protein
MAADPVPEDAMPGTPAHPRARYTKAQKAQAVGQALATSGKAASEALGIPMTTISYWMHHPDFVELRNKAREDVADEMWVTIQIGVREVARAFPDPTATLRDKALALGILYDKHALLTGAATSRTESRDLTGTLSDAELLAAIREAERITGEAGAPVEDQVPAEG